METDSGDQTVRHIFRWDLDKTYLSTEFDSVRDLIRTALQRPEDKVTVPGADGLLRELSRPHRDGRAVITFISGSPEQMRRTLEQKFALDGIRPDAFILKPQLKLLLRGKFRAIRGQIGYKLDALLRVRTMTSLGPETLFGDDAEQDAFIYSLYADLVAGRIDGDLLRRILDAARVYPDTRDLILERARTTTHQDTAQRVFINLDRQSAPGRFLPFGPRVIPIKNYFQAALVLLRDDVLSPRGLLRVGADMIDRAGFGLTELGNAYQDLGRRGLVDDSLVDRIDDARDEIAELDRFPDGFIERLVARLRALSPRTTAPDRAWEGPPDYLEILEADREMREALEEEPASGKGFLGRFRS